MSDVKEFSKNYSAKSVALNTIYNLAGYGLPLLLAVIILPVLIKGLGDEKFGVLNLAWIVVGYFTFLDFGIGRTLTKYIAEKIGQNRLEEIPDMFWTSFFLMGLVSLIGIVVSLLLTPYLVEHVFKITPGLQSDAKKTFYILALSVPIITTTAGFKGVLEAYQKFAVINVIRILLGVFTFLGPFLCLYFTKELFWIVLLLILFRILIWLLYLIQCFKINPEIKNKIRVRKELFKPVIKLSGWMTVSNLIGPFILYLDRFFIGALISASAITYYSIPYEVISKLLLIPGALMGALFPVFSANYLINSDLGEKLFFRGAKFIFLLLFPITLILTAFSYEILQIWISNSFASESYIVLSFLSIGVLFNSLAYIPFTFLQGIGKPDLTSKIQIAETPFYLIFMFMAVKTMNINGAALVWMLRSIADSFLLFKFSNKFMNNKIKLKETIFIVLSSLFMIIIFFVHSILFKAAFVSIGLIIFAMLVLKYIITKEEYLYIKNKIVKAIFFRRELQ